jgi:hypothetical protein
MATAPLNPLERAYELIQQERLDDAVSLLRQVVAREPDNVDAWWLMANAVTDPQAAHQALSNVLRLDPQHGDAREAYSQLIAEFPHFAASAEATPVSGEFSPDVPVDIDDLLRRTGALDNRRNEPLSRPADGLDVSSAYLDRLWESRQTSETEMEAGAEAQNLDDFFGGREVVDVPVTPTEDEDLEAIFRGEVPPSVQAEAEEAATFTFDDVELEDEALAAEAAEVGVSLDDFFGPAAEEELEAEVAEADEVVPEFIAADDDQGLEEFFRPSLPDDGALEAEPALEGEGPLTDPYAEPAFVESVAPPEPRRRQQKAAPAPKTEPVRVVKAPDPFELERSAHRRSGLLRVLLLAAVVVIVGGIGVLLLQTPVSAPSTDPAVSAIAQDLAGERFEGVTAVRTDDSVVVTVCSLAGPGLQAQVYRAMDLIAVRVADARESFRTAQIEVVTCGQPDQKLYRATAPVEAVIRYIDGGRQDARAYRASWQAN